MLYLTEIGPLLVDSKKRMYLQDPRLVLGISVPSSHACPAFLQFETLGNSLVLIVQVGVQKRQGELLRRCSPSLLCLGGIGVEGEFCNLYGGSYLGEAEVGSDKPIYS